jgi:dipeptidase E
MKRLYLSSYQIGQAPQELKALVAPGTRAAIIMNALDMYGARLPDQIESHIQALAELGIESDELDLRDFFGQNKRMRESLARYGLIWAVGGNAFLLRRAMRASGLDEIVRSRVNDGSLVWAGFSAGSVVATPTLRGIEIIDDPGETPEGYENTEPMWDGLGFVPYSIAPHYRSDHPESQIVEMLVEHFEVNNMPFKTLRDGEAIVVNGDAERTVGSAA